MSQGRPHGLHPHIIVRDAPAAARFYEDVFGAAELFRNALPDGRVLFIELAVGPNRLLVAEEVQGMNALAPPTIGGSPVLLLLEVADVDQVVERAVGAGAAVEMPVDEMFWGERYGIVRDPFGHRWAVSTARQEATPDDIAAHTPNQVGWESRR
jgi:PhnB protein